MVSVAYLSFYLSRQTPTQPPAPTPSVPDVIPANINPFHPVGPTPPNPPPTPPTPHPNPPSPPVTFTPRLNLISAVTNDQQGLVNVMYSITANTQLPQQSSMDIWFKTFANGVPLSTSNDILQIPLTQKMLNGQSHSASIDMFSFGNIIKGAALSVEAQVHNNFTGDVTYPIGNKAIIKVDMGSNNSQQTPYHSPEPTSSNKSTAMDLMPNISPISIPASFGPQSGPATFAPQPTLMPNINHTATPTTFAPQARIMPTKPTAKLLPGMTRK
jgi:hypothetical protein